MNNTDSNYHGKLWFDWISARQEKMLQHQKSTSS